MRQFWKDYIAMRPGTPGGERAIEETKHSFRGVSSPAPAPLELPSPEKPRKPPYQMSGADVLIGLLVFLATSLVLWRSPSMDGGTAAAFGFVSGAVAARWWRHLLIMAILLAAFFFFYHLK